MSKEPICDPSTGVCKLPDSSEKTTTAPKPLKPLSTFGIFREVGVTTLLNDKGETIPIDSVPPKPILLLYFSAHWCPPCRQFTPKLSQFVTQHSDKITCLLISSDQDPEKHMEYLTEHCHGMYSVPFEICRKLQFNYGISSIPTLLVMNSDGQLITKSGREAVAGNEIACLDEWLEGRSGTIVGSGVNWVSIVFYVGLFAFWLWYSRGRQVEGRDKKVL